MSNVLIVGEVKNGELKKISKELTSAGRKIADALGGKVIALVIDDKADSVSAELKAVGADIIVNAKEIGEGDPFATYSSR